MTTDTNSDSAGLHPNATASHAPGHRRAKGKTLARTTLALAVVLGTGSGSVAIAQAATMGPTNSTRASAARPAWTPPAAAGTVESVGTGTFTVKERSGTIVTVNVTPGTTTYRDPKVTSPGFGNISKGEMVSVQGTTASDVVSATSVSIGFGGFGAFGGGFGHGTPPAAAGTVESVGTGTFTVKERSGTIVTVNVTPGTTTYRDPKVTSPGFGNISKGEMVSVQGTTASDVVSATSVSIGFGGFGAFGGGFGHGTPPAAAGTVESVGTGTFTVKERSGTIVTVNVTPGTTTYRDPKVTSPGFGNISKGEMVSVQGTTASDVVSATSVSIGFGGFGAGMGHGHGGFAPASAS